MSRFLNALGEVNRTLLVVTIVVTIAAAVSFTLCERKWSQAAQAEQDDIEREYRELLDTYGRSN